MECLNSTKKRCEGIVVRLLVPGGSSKCDEIREKLHRIRTSGGKLVLQDGTKLYARGWLVALWKKLQEMLAGICPYSNTLEEFSRLIFSC